jgi:hypothetical protein
MDDPALRDEDGDPRALTGTRLDTLIGVWSARVIFAIGIAYVVTLVSGFVSLGNIRDPLEDPYLAIAELLTIFSAVALVMLMVAIHACAPAHARTFSTTALGWILATAAVTMTVHFVQLTVARRIDPSTVPGFDRLFGWHWPSMMWGAEITAWDLFLGLSLLCAAQVFAGRRYAMVRRGLLVSGSLCLAGLVGPALNAMAWRELGIFGYGVVLPLTCLALSRAFASASTPPPLTGKRRREDSAIGPKATTP